MPKHTLGELQQMQSLSLNAKIQMTRQRIKGWVEEFGEDGVYISFSGGKDSTVLLDIVRKDYPNIPAVFVDVPTQFPELREFVKTFDNVEILHSKMTFMQVCEKYGFPMISKEVSEVVQGARRYLTSVIEEMNASTDRQTDRRTTTDLREYVDSMNTQNLRGGVRQEVVKPHRDREVSTDGEFP